MAIFIGYLIGIVFAWLITAILNDREESSDNYISGGYSLLSWAYVLGIVIMLCFKFFGDIKPTLKFKKHDKRTKE